jgi:hypothetical protein
MAPPGNRARIRHGVETAPSRTYEIGEAHNLGRAESERDLVMERVKGIEPSS